MWYDKYSARGHTVMMKETLEPRNNNDEVAAVCNKTLHHKEAWIAWTSNLTNRHLVTI